MTDNDKLFGMIAIKLGYVTKEEVLETLKLQKSVEETGVIKRIGDYLLAAGKLNDTQISQITAIQQKYVNKSNSTYIEETASSGPSAVKSGINNSSTHIENDETQPAANATYVESAGVVTNSNSTYVEVDPSAAVSEEIQSNNSKNSQKALKNITLNGVNYSIIRQLDVASGEADLFVIEDASQQKLVFKYYRPKIEPKEEIHEILKSLPETSVIKLIETGKTSNGRSYEIQEYAEYSSLAEYLKHHSPVSAVFVKEFCVKLNKCLTEIHSKNVIHRDIKPANILIKKIEPLELVLTDFGISSIAELSMHQTSMSRTIIYSSPESMTGVVSKSSDYWAMGLIALEMLLNKHPFSGADDKAIMFTLATKNVPCINEIESDFVNLIKGLLTRDPRKRWGYKEVEKYCTATASAEKNSIPVYFEEQSDSTQTFSQNISSDNARTSAVTARKLRPYKFNGSEYYSLEELSLPMAKNWDLAVKDFESNELRDWIVREVRDKGTQALFEDLMNDKKLNIDKKVFEFLCRVNPNCPFIYQGILISKEWLIDVATRILSGDANAVEKKIISDLKDGSLVERYYKINGSDNFYDLFKPILNDWKLISNEPAILANVVLLNFSNNFKTNLIEKIKVEFKNSLIISPLEGFLTVKESVEAIARVFQSLCSNSDLVAISAANENNYIKTKDIICFTKQILEEGQYAKTVIDIPKVITKEIIVINFEMKTDNTLVNVLKDNIDDLQYALKINVKLYAILLLVYFSKEFRPMLMETVKRKLSDYVIIKSFEPYRNVEDVEVIVNRLLNQNDCSALNLALLSEVQNEFLVSKDEIKKKTMILKESLDELSENIDHKNIIKILVDNSNKFIQNTDNRNILTDLLTDFHNEKIVPNYSVSYYTKLINYLSIIDELREWLTIEIKSLHSELSKKNNNIEPGINVKRLIESPKLYSFDYYLSLRMAEDEIKCAEEIKNTRKKKIIVVALITLIFILIIFCMTYAHLDFLERQKFEAETIAKKSRIIEENKKALVEAAKTGKLSIDIGGNVIIQMIKIPAGRFQMGSNDGDINEQPIHTVSISRDYYMGIYEVTLRQWRQIMGNDPSHFKKGYDYPVENVNWNDSRQFINGLNALKFIDAEFRLPTEAEWEYACRGGTQTEFYWGVDSMPTASDYEWVAWDQTHPVGQKKPNAFGLYDMQGNVAEWCFDVYGAYSKVAVTDPRGEGSGFYCVIRGGSWFYYSSYPYCRSAARYYERPHTRYNFVGFRLVLSGRD